MKRVRSIIMLGVIILPLLAKADVVWSGIQAQQYGSFDPPLDFDINNDGVVDFFFSGGSGLDFYFNPVNGNKGLGLLAYTYDPLPEGMSIGPDLGAPYLWGDDSCYLLGYVGAEDGSLYGGGTFYDTNAFLGVSFQVADAIHYGWVRLVHDDESPLPDRFLLTIQEWAWETQAGTGIVAGAVPEPTTGVLTMIGSFSLLAVARARRRGSWRFSTVPKGRPRRSADPTHW